MNPESGARHDRQGAPETCHVLSSLNLKSKLPFSRGEGLSGIDFPAHISYPTFIYLEPDDIRACLVYADRLVSPERVERYCEL